MDLHHKLRRPRGSSIHACNICGKEGHQAAQCPNGTVNWGDRFKGNWGGVTWGLDTTPRHADVRRHPWDKEVIDYADIRKTATTYAKERAAKLESGELDPAKEAEELVQKKAKEMQDKKRRWIENEQAEKAAKKAKEAAEIAAKEREEKAKVEARERAAAAKAAAKAAAEAAKNVPAPVKPKSELGQWVEYKDPQDRPYYYNTHTKETKWDKPAQFTPAQPAGAAQVQQQPVQYLKGTDAWAALDAAKARQQAQPARQVQPEPVQQNFGGGGGGGAPMGRGGGFGSGPVVPGSGRGRDLVKPAWMVAKEREEAAAAGR